MKNIYTLIAFGFVFCFNFSSVIAQTNPTPQSIPFTFSSQTGSTLPAGIALHRFGTTSAAIPTTRILIQGNGDLPYVAGSTSGGWNDQGANGIGILASGSQAAGALIVSINTLGNTNIQIAWTIRTILNQASRDNSIALQYRVGTSGDFIDVGTTSTYTSQGKAANDFASFSEILPTQAENQSEVQVRWIYWESNGTTGSRDRLAVDEINITGSTGGDVTPPTITTLSPANNATNVLINTQLQIVFNENIQKGTSGNIIVKKFSDNSIVQTIDITTAAVSVTNKTATISINPLAYSTGYYIEVDAGAFKDIAGNNFAGIIGNSTWKFDTQNPDVSPPTITSFSPANNATAVPPNTTLQIVFNENIQKGSGNIVIKNFSNNSVVLTISATSLAVIVNNATATISISPLSFSTTYYVEIDAGAFQDIALNNFAGISGNGTWKFSTDQQPASGVIGFNYNFNNCAAYYTQGFRQYSVTGAEIWNCTKFGRTYTVDPSTDSAIQMNGFNVSAQNNEDWFISPAFDLSGAASAYVRFYSRSKFAGNGLVLKVSANYPGYGNPNLYTWTNLNGNFPISNSDVWTLSDSIYLSSFLVPNVHLAWVYTSTTAAASRWTLDDIRVSIGCTPPATQATTLNLTPTIVSVNGSFTGAAAPADAYLVIMSSSPSLTVQPTPGTAYAVDDVIGNGTVISTGNNLSFTVNNLNPSTQYYFFVYAYSSLQSCYNTINPLTGNVTTLASPSCSPPTIQATNLNATVTGNSINLTYTRGNGDNILVVARVNGSVNQNPIVGVNYTAGSQIGSGNFVIYNGPASNFSYTTLTQNTTYYFALYEYYNTNYCYNLTPLTGNFTTSCITAVNVSSLNAVAGNTLVNVAWTNPTASCYNEILVVASNAPITGQGSDFAGPPNPAYAGPNQIVYRGLGTSVTVTALTNATTYYFKVFTKNGSTYSSGVSISATPFDPAAGFVYLYGNLHSHSSYSDGNKENTAKKPIDDYQFARDANCMDFLGISEHNHSGAGMNVANYPLGFADANTVNGVVSPTTGNSIVTLWGMEWGVISGGGHVVTYGFDDQLIGWEPGNYNIFCAKNDYASLFNLINGQPNAFATLAHPNLNAPTSTSDFGNLTYTPYSLSADNAIVGSAIESGPAFSTDTTYSNFPSPLSFFEYYKIMLAKGYHMGASMDGDNHYLTFGKQSTNRLVVLATSKTRTNIVAAIKEMRFFASNDCNVRIDYKIYSNVMGSSLVHANVPNITLNIIDPDPLDIVDSVYIFGGKVGDPAPADPIKKYYNVSSVTFNSTDIENIQPDNTTWYYFTVVKQQDGNRVISSPIWYSRNDAALPVTLFNFNATYNRSNKTTLLTWSTAQEINSKSFLVQRSIDGGRTFTSIGSVNAKGNSTSTNVYNFTDLAPVSGTNLYRLKEVDIDDKFQYSNIVSVDIKDKQSDYYSLFPNPAHQFTYINSTNAQNREVRIILVDASGRILKDKSDRIDNGHPFKLNLDGISQGVYFIKIISDGVNNTQRIIVK